MGDTYTRQSSYTDGDVITAAHTNNEFNQILAAFAASTGHSHDGTTGEGGPIAKLLSNALTFGAGTAGTDITVTFDGESNDGVIKWMEDEDYFEFSDDILIASTEKLQFRDTAIYINSSADGQLDLVADTEIQIAATTIDINGNADISGNLGIGGNLTVTGTTTFNGGTLTLGDANTDNIVFGGEVDSNIIPDDDDTYDLGSSSKQWKDIYIDGTAYIDTLDLNGTAVTSTAAEINIIDGGTAATSVTIADADRLILNDDGTMKQIAVTSLAAYLDDEITAMPNLTSVGTLGTLTVDNIIINGTTIGHTSDTDAITIASNGNVTMSQNLIVTGDLTISGDDLTMATNTAGHLLVADGTNFNPTAVGDLSEISTVANDDVFLAVDTSGGGLKKVTRSTIVSGLAIGGVALSNIVEDTTPQLGGNLDVQTNSLVSTSNRNISITPNGSGVVNLDGVEVSDGIVGIKTGTGNVAKILFYCESGNAHAQTLQAQPHSASASDVLVLPTGGNSTLVSRISTDTLTNKTLTAPTLTGTATVASLDISGDIDVDGTTNLDVVDIDGAVDMASTATITGNLTLGAQLIMPDVTSTKILVADGTSFQEVAVSGDITIANTGAVTIANTAVETAMIAADAITEAKIADNAVESEHINDNVISGQTELASGIADTDELLISDAGTIKRVDASVFKTYIGAADDATALAIALG